MGRRYSVPLTGCALTAAGEMIAITAPASKPFRVTRIVIRAVNSTPPTSQEFQFAGKVFTSATGGTGGTSVTPQQHLQGDAAASCTVLRQNTSVNSGTLGSTPYQDGCFSNQGIDTPAPGAGIEVSGGQIFVLTLVQSPLSGTSVSFDGRVEIEEHF